MVSKEKVTKPRVRRSLEARAKEAEMESRRLNALQKAGDDENLKSLLAAARHLSRLTSFGNKAADDQIRQSFTALQAALKTLGI